MNLGCNLRTANLPCLFEGFRYPSVDHARAAAKSADASVRKRFCNSQMSGKEALMATSRSSGFRLRADYKDIEAGLPFLLANGVSAVNSTFVADLLATGKVALRNEQGVGEHIDNLYGIARNKKGKNLWGQALVRLRSEFEIATTKARKEKAAALQAAFQERKRAKETATAELRERREGEGEKEKIDSEEKIAPSQHFQTTPPPSLHPHTNSQPAGDGGGVDAQLRAAKELSMGAQQEPAVRTKDAHTLEKVRSATTSAVSASSPATSGPDAIPSSSTMAATAKEAGCTIAKLKTEKRRIEEQLRREQKRSRINKAAGTTGSTQVNPIDHHGKGIGKGQRKAKTKAKAAAMKTATEERARENAAAKAQKKPPCAFYARGYADGSKHGSGMGCEELNRCRGPCLREHSEAVSNANIARWKKKKKNAAKTMSSTGRARINPDDIRTGTIVSFKDGRGQGTGYGHILPDANEIYSNKRKQWVFFHISNWTGKVDSLPNGDNWHNMQVRYVRAVDQRSQGKWCAVQVSKR